MMVGEKTSMQIQDEFWRNPSIEFSEKVWLPSDKAILIEDIKKE